MGNIVAQITLVSSWGGLANVMRTHMYVVCYTSKFLTIPSSGDMSCVYSNYTRFQSIYTCHDILYGLTPRPYVQLIFRCCNFLS